jgi:hypothetical protein
MPEFVADLVKAPLVLEFKLLDFKLDIRVFDVADLWDRLAHRSTF